MRRLTMSALFLLVAAAPASAAPIGPVYPAPGGNTFSSSGGSLVASPGVTRSYAGFDSSQWAELYWNLTSANIGNLSFSMDTTPYTLSGNTVTWLPAGLWQFNTTSGTVSTQVRLVTSFFRADGVTPLTAADFVTAASLGSPAQMAAVVLDITPAKLAAWGGGFRVSQVFQTIGGQDAGAFYNQFSTFGGFNSATNSAGFFYSPVPEPSSMALLGLGLLGIARRLRRTRD